MVHILYNQQSYLNANTETRKDENIIILPFSRCVPPLVTVWFPPEATMLAHSLHFPASPPASDRHLVPAFVLDQAVFVQSCWGRSYIVILNSCEYDTLPLDQAVSVHPLILSAKLPRVSLPRTASEDSAGKALTKTTGRRLKNRRTLIWNWIFVHFSCLWWMMADWSLVFSSL